MYAGNSGRARVLRVTVSNFHCNNLSHHTLFNQTIPREMQINCKTTKYDCRDVAKSVEGLKGKIETETFDADL